MARYIEITGPVCSGKTSLIINLKNKHNKLNFFNDNIFFLLFRKNYFNNFITNFIGKCILLLFSSLFLFKKKEIIIFFFSEIVRYEKNFFLRLRILVNSLLKFSRYNFVNNFFSKNEIIIFDEGISHTIFNLASAKQTINLDLNSYYINFRYFLKNVEVVILTVDKEIADQRLRGRGHWRDKIYTAKQMNYFLDQNLFIQDYMISNSNVMYKNFIVLKSNEISYDELMKKINF